MIITDFGLFVPPAITAALDYSRRNDEFFTLIPKICYDIARGTSPVENTRILKSVFVFRGLSQIQLAQFNKVLRHQSVEHGARLIEEGSQPDRMYVILKGCFLVVKQAEDSEGTIAALGEGEHFGEMGLIDKGPRSASVVADSDGEVIFLTRTDFERILAAFPEIKLIIYENFLESLCERLRSSNENLLIAAHPAAG